MSPNGFRSIIKNDFSKLRIIKNLAMISLGFFFIYSADDGLVMLQTTMNKEGIGAASLAVAFSTYALISLVLSSFLVKKLGTKNSQLLGLILMLPYIASNIYPTWLTLLPSAVFRGIGVSLLWAAQSTYFNESSVLLCRIDKKERKHKYVSNIATKCDDCKEITSFKPPEQEIEQLSALNLLSKTGNSFASNRKSTLYQENASPVRLTGYRYKQDDLIENKLILLEKIGERTKETEGYNLKMFNDSGSPEKAKNSIEKKEEMVLDEVLEKQEEINGVMKFQSHVDSTKSFFFGIHGLAYHSAAISSSLISYFILKKTDTNYNADSNSTCGARFCSTDIKGFSTSVRLEEVPDGTRYLLIRAYAACGFAAPIIILLFLDRMEKLNKDVKLSWDHVFATIKYIKKKDQLLLIPFSIGATLCRGFYMADFTKSYIACAWSISHIGLITVIYGVASALSSLLSGVIIKYIGRRSFMATFQIFTIANFVFLLFWNPDAQKPYVFYVQGGIFGVISGIFNSQIRAFYGILFEGDEETAFSSLNLYTAIGWSVPCIYNDLLCTSVKIYIVLAFSCTGLLGYLLAERSYSLRRKQTDSTK